MTEYVIMLYSTRLYNNANTQTLMLNFFLIDPKLGKRRNWNCQIPGLRHLNISLIQ